MSLKEKIEQDKIHAMRSQDKQRLGVIRLLINAIKQREIADLAKLDDTQIITVIDQMLKQRRDSIEQYQKANRADLAQQERYEIEVLQEYLPERLTATEIEQLIAEAINESNATAMKDMGKVMAVLKPKIQGRADIAEVSNLVKAKLQ